MDNNGNTNMDDRKYGIVVSARLTEEEVEFIDTMASVDDRSRAYILQKIIRLGLAQLTATNSN